MIVLNDPIIHQVYAVLDQLEIPRNKLTPNDYGRLTSNLFLLKAAAQGTTPEELDQKWNQFLEHLTYPEDCPAPKGLFRLPVAEMMHYNLLMKAIEEIYDAHAV